MLEQTSTVRRIVGPTILLYSGNYFDFEDPEGSFFDVGDIARGLSHICRFGGQCGRFYSVAEHSVYVSQIVPPEHAFAALMHDAPEAVIGDMVKPLKVMCADYRAVEDRVEAVVLGRFGATLPLAPCIKEADIVMLATEQAQLMNNRDDWEYTRGRELADITIQALSPDAAFNMFLDRFDELSAIPSGIARLPVPEPRTSIAQYLDNQAAMRGRGLGRALRVMASNVRAVLYLQEQDDEE